MEQREFLVRAADLTWCQLSGSERQLDDCIGVWKVQKDRLDGDYLRHWAAQLALTDLLSQVTQG